MDLAIVGDCIEDVLQLVLDFVVVDMGVGVGVGVLVATSDIDARIIELNVLSAEGN